MKSKILAVLSDVRRLLLSLTVAIVLAKMGTLPALYAGICYILFCIPLCILGETWQDRLFALLTAAWIGFMVAIPFLISILS